ncbi:MAG: diacylglycerol kinase family protein [Bacteroidota bacterium]
MKTLLIINPNSRGGKSALLAEKAMKHLRRKNIEFEAVFLTEFEDAYNFSVKANEENVGNIIAVGGDGTINKVINGFYDDSGKIKSNCHFGVIYTGTSPDFCKSYGIPTDIIKASDIIINQKTIKIPIGKIEFQQENRLKNRGDSVQSKYFACCANIGLGASLARKANSGIRSYAGDFLGTFISLLQILRTYRGTDYFVKIDNKSMELNNVYNISVGITKYIASGIKVFQAENKPKSSFYLMKLSNLRFGNIPSMLKNIYSGKEFPNSTFLSIDYVKRIEINNNSMNPEVEFDGDPAGSLPCSIEMAEDKLSLLT